MERRIVKSILLNDPTAAMINTSAVSGYVKLPYIDLIRLSDIKSKVEVASAAEVRQLVTITMPTIAAETRYAIKVGNTQQRREEVGQNLKIFGHTTGALSGDATTDKYNVAKAMAYKINQSKLFCKAGPTVTLTHAAGNAVAQFDTVTGATSGATGVAITVAAGSTVVIVTSGTFVAETVTSSLGVSNTVSATTVSGNMAILDDAGYFPAKGVRKGKNTVLAVQNINQSAVAITTAAVYSVGQGTRMLDDVPVKEVLSDNLASGNWDFPTNEAPQAGKEYQLFVLNTEEPAPANSVINAQVNVLKAYRIYLRKDATNYAATRTAILAL